jgi:DHA1 family bicyclomycin/chloramphenicol resistance-like MFS transporter
MSNARSVRFLDRSTPPHIATLILIAGLAALSLNIFLPSLPLMADHFGVGYGVVQLSVSLYLAATAVLQVFVGPISDRYGRRPVMLVATAIFTLASFGAVFAPSFGLFLTCRLLQAAIATGFVLSRAVVRDMVAQNEAASMIGYVTMGMSVVPMVGPVIGGALGEVFGWQSTFVLLGLGGLALLALVWADQGETNLRRSGSMADQLAQYPQLLRSQRFWGYCLAAAFASGAFFAYLGGAPFIGLDVFHLRPATLGFYFGAPALGYMLGNFLSGRFSVRMGVDRMVMAGALLTTAGLGLLLALDLAGIMGPGIFFGLVITVGLGNGILLPNANAGMLSVRPDLAGTAAGLGGAFTVGGGALFSALAGALLQPGSGPMPLILIMLGCSALPVLSVLWMTRDGRGTPAV